MKELERKDWELVKTQVEQERRTILITLEINNVTLDMIDQKLGDFPYDEPKDKSKKPTKTIPSSYVG